MGGTFASPPISLHRPCSVPDRPCVGLSMVLYPLPTFMFSLLRNAVSTRWKPQVLPYVALTANSGWPYRYVRKRKGARRYPAAKNCITRNTAKLAFILQSIHVSTNPKTGGDRGCRPASHDNNDAARPVLGLVINSPVSGEVRFEFRQTRHFLVFSTAATESARA